MNIKPGQIYNNFEHYYFIHKVTDNTVFYFFWDAGLTWIYFDLPELEFIDHFIETWIVDEI